MKRIFGVFIMAVFFLSGCYKPGPGAQPWKVSGLYDSDEQIEITAAATAYVMNDPRVKPILPTPTPNVPIILPTPRSSTLTYTVQVGDTLRLIAQQYQVSVDQIVSTNNLYNPNLIEVGQDLIIPPPSIESIAPAYKIIPDSELVNSPSNAAFDVESFINSTNGYLTSYTEEVDGVSTSGIDIVKRVALEYSVNPRLILTILEYQSHWITEKAPDEETLVYPMRYYAAWYEGLYQQLGWAANLLNEGYYLWKINAITVWTLSDSSVIQVDPTINPGTAGVINLMRYLNDETTWEKAISEGGIFDTYYRFFGNPFKYAVEPMIPDDLTQPALQLPFEARVVWSFTGGPHGGWNTGSAWAALDFAPPGTALGCFPSEAWVTASAPGEIVYADHGAVIEDLDGDGIWQTGWSILYMHIDSWERIEVGQMIAAGDRIGHPSCEGGFSTGTHLHIARRYNGEWIAADSDVPLIMDGWKAVGYGVEYNGYLVNGDETVEAWDGRSTLNAIKR